MTQYTYHGLAGFWEALDDEANSECGMFKKFDAMLEFLYGDRLDGEKYPSLDDFIILFDLLMFPSLSLILSIVLFTVSSFVKRDVVFKVKI